MSEGAVVPEGPEDVNALAEEEAEAVNKGKQSKIGTNRRRKREDVDSPVPPRSGVGTSDAGVETTAQPPVAAQEGEDALANPERAEQADAIVTKPGGDERPVTSGSKKVKYVGYAGSYVEGDTTFPKGKRVTVSGNTAARLLARTDFVSAD